MNINRRILFAMAAVLGLVVLAETGIFLKNKLKKRSSLPPIVEETADRAGESAKPAPLSAPTTSPEEIKTIAAAQTHQIKVSADKTGPYNLTIKQYDQVRWDNETGQKMVVKVFNQDSPPLAKGKKFLTTFRQKGSFTYRVLLDNREKFRGTIKVK